MEALSLDGLHKNYEELLNSADVSHLRIFLGGEYFWRPALQSKRMTYFQAGETDWFEDYMECTVLPAPTVDGLVTHDDLVGQSFLRGHSPVLQVLIVHEPSLLSLPESIGGLTALQTLDVSECGQLTSLPESLAAL